MSILVSVWKLVAKTNKRAASVKFVQAGFSTEYSLYNWYIYSSTAYLKLGLFQVNSSMLLPVKEVSVSSAVYCKAFFVVRRFVS